MRGLLGEANGPPAMSRVTPSSPTTPTLGPLQSQPAVRPAESLRPSASAAGLRWQRSARSVSARVCVGVEVRPQSMRRRFWRELLSQGWQNIFGLQHLNSLAERGSVIGRKNSFRSPPLPSLGSHAGQVFAEQVFGRRPGSWHGAPETLGRPERRQEGSAGMRGAPFAPHNQPCSTSPSPC